MQEVWRGRLPRLGVVNSIGRKKIEEIISAVLALLQEVHFVGFVGVAELLEYLGTGLKIVVVESFGQVSAIVGEIIVQGWGKSLEYCLVVCLCTGCVHEESLVAQRLDNSEELQLR